MRIERLESELNKILKRFGYEYKAIIIDDPNRDKYGEIDTKNKIIYIYTSDEKRVYRILLHEIIELELNPLINKYIRFINKLMEYIQEELYRDKERTIKEFIEKIGIRLINERYR